MTQANLAASWQQREAFIAAFESACVQGAEPDLAGYLPAADHPLRAEVLRELVRVALEHHSQRGQPVRADDYLRRFPELAGDGDGLAAIAFEEYRLRRQAGEPVAPADYERRYGVAVT